MKQRPKFPDSATNELRHKKIHFEHITTVRRKRDHSHKTPQIRQTFQKRSDMKNISKEVKKSRV